MLLNFVHETIATISVRFNFFRSHVAPKSLLFVSIKLREKFDGIFAIQFRFGFSELKKELRQFDSTAC